MAGPVWSTGEGRNQEVNLKCVGLERPEKHFCLLRASEYERIEIPHSENLENFCISFGSKETATSFSIKKLSVYLFIFDRQQQCAFLSVLSSQMPWRERFAVKRTERISLEVRSDRCY